MAEPAEDTGVHVRIGGKELSLAISEEHALRLKALAQQILREPFTKRPWAEPVFFLVSGGLAGLGLAFVGVTMVAGVVLAITFFGLALLALSIRSARGMGGWQRGLARAMLDETVEDPEPFAGRREASSGGCRPRCATGWAGAPWPTSPSRCPGPSSACSWPSACGWDAFACLTGPIFNRGGGGPAVWGLARGIFPGSQSWFGQEDFLHGVGVFILGAIFLFAAPWVTRGFVTVDRLLIRSLLGPDPTAAAPPRTLEQARTQTVDASAATLRRIERDLHDGTQAQLVALAMRLGMAKEKLEDADTVDLERVRELVDEAHRGAKEAIAELRDIARGIHPPALDIGLEGALATLAARAPSRPRSSSTCGRGRRPPSRPSPTSASPSCWPTWPSTRRPRGRPSRARQQGTWLRLVVRDDGLGGAELSRVGSSSSGLSGLTDRVHAVDGRLHLVSPHGGPTVVTVDLPLTA